MKRITLLLFLAFGLWHACLAQVTSRRFPILKINKVEYNTISYRANAVLQYGGESKLTLMPKLNFLRVHELEGFSPYYGLEAGILPMFTFGAFSFSAIGGFEKGMFSIETSLSHFRTTRISDNMGGHKGPFSQNLLNLKLGVQLWEVRLKFGVSFLLKENIPNGDEPIPLLKIGEINDIIFGIEIQFQLT